MSKIVVFDSGFGGLTVLKELLKVLPNEEYIYYGDSANAPYGEKTHDELLELTSAICSKVSDAYDVKGFVIACNTTTSEVWNELTEKYSDYGFVGIEPALAWAVRENPGKHILVLATTGTIKGKRLRARYEEFKDQADITLLAAPGIVPFVEKCDTDSEEFKAYLEELLKPYRDTVDCIVLGCTHFPFVKNEIREAVGREIRFYDAAVTVAGEVRGRLEKKQALAASSEPEKAAAGEAKAAGKEEKAAAEEEKAAAEEEKAAAGEEKAAGKEPQGAASSEPQVIYLNSDPTKVELEARLLGIYAQI